MKRMLLVAALFAVIAACGYTESGIGVHVSYPVPTTGFKPLNEYTYYDMNYGIDFREKRSLFLLDISADFRLFPDSGFEIASIMGNIDAGLCFDISILRLGIMGGVNLGYGFLSKDFIWAPNVKASVDFKLGPITIGVAGLMAFPIDVAQLAYLYAPISINFLYWFGSDKKAAEEETS